MSCRIVSPATAQVRAATGRLIDVRTPAEFAAVHAVGAVNMPLDRLDVTAVGSGPVTVICQSGGRGKLACDRLRAAGLADVVNVEGGTAAWERAGLPTVRGRRVMSLERQVRVAAGSLVLVGLATGLLLHPAGFWLSAFVGGGLVFSGLTDTCGMGVLLARMPWNTRVAGCQS